MVRTRFLHRLGLGALDEAGIGEPSGQRVPLLLGGLHGLGETDPLGVEILGPAEREEEIARMLAGAQITDAARAAARALMDA